MTVTSTLSETYLNFAQLLASTGHNAEAREWIQKVLDKKPTMPSSISGGASGRGSGGPANF